MRRRAFLRGALGLGAAAAAGCAAPTEDADVLRVVPHADLQALDPIVTTQGIVQRHALLTHDFLFALDETLTPQPQMLASHEVSRDGRTHTLRLREGLAFHDGQPVRAADVIASLRRWGARDVYGRQLTALTETLAAADPATVRWRLARPYGPFAHALAKTGGPVAAIMPERLAQQSAETGLKEVVGAGPYEFARAEWIPGAKVVYRRNPRYLPRSEAASGAAGGKIARIETIEWLNIRDPQSAALALAGGEVDLVETPAPDFLPMLRAAGVVIADLDRLGQQGLVRMNHLHPPFSDPRARQALVFLIDQARYLQAMFGNPALSTVCHDFFVCGGPHASGAGVPAGVGKDLARARALLAASGYDGRPLVVLHPTDIQFLNLATLVLAEDLKAIGAAVALEPMDFGAMAARRANRAPPQAGGWDLGLSYWPGATMADPVGNAPMQASCEKAWAGWPCDPAHQALIDRYPFAQTAAERGAIAAAVQESAYALVPYVPIGQWRTPAAYSPRLSGVLTGPATMILWNIAKAPRTPLT